MSEPTPDAPCHFCCGDAQSMCLHPRDASCSFCQWRDSPCPHDYEVERDSASECSMCLRDFVRSAQADATRAAYREAAQRLESLRDDLAVGSARWSAMNDAMRAMLARARSMAEPGGSV